MPPSPPCSADLTHLQVEATKFTEVGYHGRDVDTIIRDLLEAGISLVRSRLRKQHEAALKMVCGPTGRSGVGWDGNNGRAGFLGCGNNSGLGWAVTMIPCV